MKTTTKVIIGLSAVLFVALCAIGGLLYVGKNNSDTIITLTTLNERLRSDYRALIAELDRYKAGVIAVEDTNRELTETNKRLRDANLRATNQLSNIRGAVEGIGTGLGEAEDIIDRLIETVERIRTTLGLSTS